MNSEPARIFAFFPRFGKPGSGREQNHSHSYSNYAARDFRELKPGEPGNCAAIAETKRIELARHRVQATMMTCRLRDGQGHAFLFLNDGRVLDNRLDEPDQFR